MLTLGIDLASQAKKTGVAVVRWTSAKVELVELRVGADDHALIGMASNADAIGIDSPFGWPQTFEDFLAEREAPEPWTNARRDSLRFRRTDHHVRELLGRWPLSVSSDLLAIPAMRCRGLLRDQEELQREAARALALIGGPEARAGLELLLAEIDAKSEHGFTDEALRTELTRAWSRLAG